MPIDTSDHSDLRRGSSLNGSAQHEQWQRLRQRVIDRGLSSTAAAVFGNSAAGGGVYRWGVAVAQGEPCDRLTEVLSRLACGDAAPRLTAKVDLAQAAEMFLDSIDSTSISSTAEAASAVRWAAALPALCQTLDAGVTWRLIQSLCELQESFSQRCSTYSPAHLILSGELGLTLAWRLNDLPSCKRLQKSAITAVGDWCQQGDEAVAAAVARPTDARLVLASLIRCQRLVEATSKRKFKKTQLSTADLLSCWVAAMTIHTGGSAFSTAPRKAVVDDCARDGLLAAATQYDPESLQPAMQAALGADHAGGRLAWEVSLPETLWHDAESKLAVMLPEWDVRRGRTHLDYSHNEPRLELFAGRAGVIAGSWQTMIEIDGKLQSPTGEWTELCEYSDDEVHYLEIEQPFSGGMLLQRQVMLLRDDRCVMLADAIVPQPSHEQADLQRSIRYTSRLPLFTGVRVDHEPETRDLFLTDTRRRGLVIPLAAGEWNVGPTAATLSASEDGHLVHSVTGAGRLYAPLWFDFQQRRFTRNRTWRQLTIGDQLRVCRRDEAAGYRVQIGSEHWVLYRSLGDRCCRTLLGRHLIADFYASRFDPGDGSHEDLVTVDDRDNFDD